MDSDVVQQLARMGVGHFIGIDHERADATNRYRSRGAGSPKFGVASVALKIGGEYWFGTPHGD